jgi:hypothetical protein
VRAGHKPVNRAGTVLSAVEGKLGFLWGAFSKSARAASNVHKNVKVNAGGCALIVCAGVSDHGGRIRVDSQFGAAYSPPDPGLSWAGEDKERSGCRSEKEASVFLVTPVGTLVRGGVPTGVRSRREQTLGPGEVVAAQTRGVPMDWVLA